jgi:hypothetical protein
MLFPHSKTPRVPTTHTLWWALPSADNPCILSPAAHTPFHSPRVSQLPIPTSTSAETHSACSPIYRGAFERHSKPIIPRVRRKHGAASCKRLYRKRAGSASTPLRRLFHQARLRYSTNAFYSTNASSQVESCGARTNPNRRMVSEYPGNPETVLNCLAI